ncbi:RDD family protein [Mycetocola tolaasinivorans]|uniref:RDD family protein n=1 Tax=Mycetocola tolaasinivorans TaxID=76635 RepID=A0A3L7AAU0_9MICO|nr:RDD family protein [Mycetocola tolaasinivorans]RLP76938.1 RDD family protein [Mycetocola tolaasinivorans]
MSGEKRPTTFGELEPSKYPGERLGLPKQGPRSIARVGRRFAALCIDWAIATAVLLPFGVPPGTLWTHVAFGVLQLLAIPTLSGSIGHRIMGLHLVRLGEGGWIGFGKPALRTLLLLLVVPALVWDSDQRGFHDKVAGTVLIRTRG